MTDLSTMTQAKWDALSERERTAMCDLSGLNPQLRGLEGHRVEVCDDSDETETLRRFIVGKSTGWRPCHLEIANRSSSGGFPARRHYASVRVLYKAR